MFEEEIANPPTPEKNFDNLYDLGINTPESNEQIQKLRQSVVKLTTELQKDENKDGRSI